MKGLFNQKSSSFPNLTYARRMILLGMVVFLFLLDQVSKVLFHRWLDVGQSVPIVQDVFHFTLVHNKGAAFSLFQEQPILLLCFTLFLFLGFLIYALKRPLLQKAEMISLSLILGGALGNIADRLTLGYVVDFLDFTLIDYPIFNLADVFIFFGIVMMIIRVLQQPVDNSTKDNGCVSHEPK
jgi:signal peptidase II